MLKQRNYTLLNDISPKGLIEFGQNYTQTEDMQDADLWLVRSKDLLETELPKRLRAIARAGAGVNNIPLSRATDQGIVVFNAPGGNANAVAELVIAGMLLASRGVLDGANWVRAQKADKEVAQLAEKHKRHSPAMRSGVRPWAWSSLARWATWLPMPPTARAWRCWGMTPLFPLSTR